MTFPPCTERTIHYVVSKTIKIGSSPIELMKEALRSPDTVDPMTKNIIRSNGDATENYRDIQPLNDRSVFYFDHEKFCGKDKSYSESSRVLPSKGHYEKLKSKNYVYMFVKGNSPSGLPDSFVVSEKEAKGKNISLKKNGDSTKRKVGKFAFSNTLNRFVEVEEDDESDFEDDEEKESIERRVSTPLTTAFR